MKAFLLGAGASRGTLDELVVPVAGEFGGTLASMAPDWARDYPALFAVVNHLGCDLQNWPLEPVWSCIDYYAKLQPALPLPKPWTNESQEIKKALLALYGQRCDEAVPSDDSTLVRLLRDEMRSGDALISFNYDTIAEELRSSTTTCVLYLTIATASDSRSRTAPLHGLWTSTPQPSRGRRTTRRLCCLR